MKFIPTRSLVLLAIVPLALSLLTPFDRSLMWPMLIADGAIVAIALVDLLLGRKALVRATIEAPEVFSIGRANPVSVVLRSTSRRRLTTEATVDLFDHAETNELPQKVRLARRGRATLKARVVPKRRGAYELGPVHVRHPSPLGLWKRQATFKQDKPVRVYPDVEAVRSWELLARQDRQHSLMRTTRRLGGESEFEQLRAYSRDDEFRSIDWKATARRGELIARQYQLESNQNLMFVLDAGRLMTAQTAGLSLFDHALNATLMLAHVAVRGGDRVGLLAYGATVRRFVPPNGGRKAVQRLISAGYDLHPELEEPDHSTAFQLLSTKVRKRTLVVLFTQAIDDRAADELVRATRSLYPRHLPLIVMFRDTDVDELLDTRARKRDLDLYVRGAAAELVSWHDAVIRRLKQSGALVLNVNPKNLTADLINRYLEIKARHLL